MKRFCTIACTAGLLGTAVCMGAQAASESVIYAFKGGPDGGGPLGGLINVGGTFYGTTTGGGTITSACPDGCGTVFKVTTGGMERVLHVFLANTLPNNGHYPDNELAFFGTTIFGFAENYQSYSEIFRVTLAGSFKALYTFQANNVGQTDGRFPYGPLIDVGGTLYGTTVEGGFYGTTTQGGSECVGYGCGTVFQISPTGVEKKLYTFQGGPDGANPNAGLINVDGTLYGTTARGGAADSGTVFKITTGGVKTVVYSFTGRTNAPSADGSGPHGLVDVGGTLYGTCTYGGAGGLGTVFKVTTAGAEKVLHSFRAGADGSVPIGSLLDVGGVLYGTTLGGGAENVGTVFKVTTTGVTTVLYAFKGAFDGGNPNGKLVNIGTTVFGTTQGGGHGFGTVFRVAP